MEGKKESCFSVRKMVRRTVGEIVRRKFIYGAVVTKGPFRPFRSSNRENHRILENCQNISSSTERTDRTTEGGTQAMIHPANWRNYEC
ncbi:hypothetical protein NPIL_394881 [Nephila pilipes]|uniref:Uncharacterized protein n=1 Tax=Nephila pilipes TaxID=299642 RepID=A0A8X6TGE2_NEPPI|nr:hypothetical protein NPIL_394881 [Nephila pilipes]